MQEYNNVWDQSSHNYVQTWSNITGDGWGVSLNDSVKEDSSITSITTDPCSSINGKPIVSTSYMYYGTEYLTSVKLDNFDTSNVTNMSYMFSNTAITSLDLSNFDTSNVIYMADMFNYAPYLVSLNISSFDTSSVISMGGMFAYDNIDSLNLSNFDTSSVTDMTSMFMQTALTSLDVSSLDTSSVTSMNGMFSSSPFLTTLDASGDFSFLNVTDLGAIFIYNNNLVVTVASSAEKTFLESFGTSLYGEYNNTVTYVVAS